MTDLLLGTWRLVSFVGRGADGREANTFGPAPRGYLMYDKGGRMSVHIARSERPVADEGGAYFGYFGSYTVDESAATVTHHVEGSSNSDFAGTDQRRYFTLAGDRLVLSTLSEQSAGAGLAYVATWERSGRP